MMDILVRSLLFVLASAILGAVGYVVAFAVMETFPAMREKRLKKLEERLPGRRNIAAWAGLIVLVNLSASGCATLVMRPGYEDEDFCVLNPEIRITNQKRKANVACHAEMPRLASDDGKKITPDDFVLGCAELQTQRIIAQNTPDTIYHEMDHLMTRHCPRTYAVAERARASKVAKGEE